jgi:hypothetical protein
MTVLRSLTLPFYPTSLIFVGISAALLAVTAIIPEEAQILRIIPAVILVSWLFNFAYSVLDDAANGAAGPPVPSVDILGPFELRPLLQLLLCAIAYTFAVFIGGNLGRLVLGIFLALLPASVGVLGVTQRPIDAINPLTLGRTAWALGPYYLLILTFIGCYAYAYSILVHFAIWRILSYALLELAVLSIFSLIGGAIFIRRAQLGFEPRASPERAAAIAEIERLKRRSRALDDAYGLVRARHYRQAADPIGQWLADLDADELPVDVRAIMTQAVQWNSERGLAEVTQRVIAHLLKIGEPDLALDAMNTTLRQLPGFAPESENDTVAMASRAKAVGNQKLAGKILANFVSRDPAHPLGAAARTLLHDLQA